MRLWTGYIVSRVSWSPLNRMKYIRQILSVVLPPFLGGEEILLVK